MHVGWIVYEGAYGKAAWKIIVQRVSDDEKVIQGHELTSPSEERTYGEGKTYWTDPKPYSYSSKEEALLSVPNWVEQGKLKSTAQTLSDYRDAKERAERWRQTQAEKEQAAREAHLEMLDGLLSIQNRAATPALRLTNSEAVALAKAIERLQTAETR